MQQMKMELVTSNNSTQQNFKKNIQIKTVETLQD